MARILGVGIATLDIINRVDGYPPEDSEVRAIGQRRARGGNATNTLAVLARLGHACAWAGVYVEEPDAATILADLDRHGVDYAPSRRLPEGKVPTSYICLNIRNGSRSIVHYRDLPEYAFEDFMQLDLSDYHWLHFEGRNVAESYRMLRHARARNPRARISLEAEKTRQELDSLFPFAELLLCSREYAKQTGHHRPEELFAELRRRGAGGILACAWGEEGAYAESEKGDFYRAPAYPPEQLVDTLGAGDTFNAGMIHALSQNRPLSESLDFACRLAGRKCGREGFDHVAVDK